MLIHHKSFVGPQSFRLLFLLPKKFLIRDMINLIHMDFRKSKKDYCLNRFSHTRYFLLFGANLSQITLICLVTLFNQNKRVNWLDLKNPASGP